MTRPARPARCAGRLLAAAACAAIAAGCASVGRRDDPWFGPDKIKHFAVSAAAGTAAAYTAARNGMDDAPAAAIGFTFALGLGAGKEWYDRDVKETYWSWRDFAWDAAGGLAGGLLGAAAGR